MENNKYEINGIEQELLKINKTLGEGFMDDSNVENQLRRLNDILEVTTKPIIYDAGTGGQNEHFKFTVRTLERLGVSAVIIDDKTGLNKNYSLGMDVQQHQYTIENFCKKFQTGEVQKKN